MFGEQFEYTRHNFIFPTNKEFALCKYESKEYRMLEYQKEYSDSLLNELGARGWDLIMSYDDLSSEGKTVKVLTFKRSSRSKFFGKGFGVDTGALNRFLKNGKAT